MKVGIFGSWVWWSSGTGAGLENSKGAFVEPVLEMPDEARDPIAVQVHPFANRPEPHRGMFPVSQDGQVAGLELAGLSIESSNSMISRPRAVLVTTPSCVGFMV